MADTPTGKRWVEQVSAFERRHNAETPYGRNRRVVVARRDDIEQALLVGHSLRTIWKFLRDQGQLDTTYASFCRVVSRLGIGKPEQPIQPLALPSPAPALPAPVAADGTAAKKPHVFQRPSDEPREFIHNPVANKKDLL